MHINSSSEEEYHEDVEEYSQSSPNQGIKRKPSSKQSSADRRREQNRLAQRKFRARQESQLNELREQVARLKSTQDTAKTQIEHQNHLIFSLRTENEQLRRNSLESSQSSSMSPNGSTKQCYIPLPSLDNTSSTSSQSSQNSPILVSSPRLPVDMSSYSSNALHLVSPSQISPAMGYMHQDLPSNTTFLPPIAPHMPYLISSPGAMSYPTGGMTSPHHSYLPQYPINGSPYQSLQRNFTGRLDLSGLQTFSPAVPMSG